jgi:XTP/dITP diphosphohydrolase
VTPRLRPDYALRALSRRFARRRLVIATTNPGKLREIEDILSGIPFALQTLEAFPKTGEPTETGQTFGENARLKAVYYASATGELTVADDSGLEIDALDGAPGIHSARWHGTDYPVKFRKIRQLLNERGLTTSSARFVCHLALARGRQILYETEQTVEGRIAEAPAGHEGFGYDPIFFYPPLGVTLAQIPRDEKSRISHRGKAFFALREFLTGSPAL